MASLTFCPKVETFIMSIAGCLRSSGLGIKKASDNFVVADPAFRPDWKITGTWVGNWKNLDFILKFIIPIPDHLLKLAEDLC